MSIWHLEMVTREMVIMTFMCVMDRILVDPFYSLVENKIMDLRTLSLMIAINLGCFKVSIFLSGDVSHACR